LRPCAATGGPAGEVCQVSRERLRQIELRAFEKVQKAMQRIAGEKLLTAA